MARSRERSNPYLPVFIRTHLAWVHICVRIGAMANVDEGVEGSFPVDR